jgi:type I restriction enzyme S subunit
MQNEKKIVPQLRFSEFKGNYNEFKLSELLTRYSENNKEEEFDIDDILSLSSHYGIVDRKELLDDTYSKVNHKNYIKTRLNDIVYGKSISKNYPYGLFKVNNCRDGLLSTLYYTFKVRKNIIPTYFDSYFSHYNRANNFLKKYVLVGDRYITADANYILSGKIFIPLKEEQQKIVDFIVSVEIQIQTLRKKRTLLEQYKKGILQKIFNKELKLKNEKGADYSAWKTVKLKSVFRRSKLKNTLNNINLVLTNSATKGIISQNDFFDKDIANKTNLKGYYVAAVNDFIYNPRISQSAPVGPLNRNKLDLGVMSPLYTVLKYIDGDIDYLEIYFQSSNWHKYMKSIANYGARHDRMNITINDFENMPIPFPCEKEQIKIASVFKAIDKNIELVSCQFESAKSFKKGLLQKMFYY